jgi:hypothetical protein
MTKLRVFISSVQPEFAGERQMLYDYLSTDALLGRFFEPFIFEKLPAAETVTLPAAEQAADQATDQAGEQPTEQPTEQVPSPKGNENDQTIFYGSPCFPDLFFLRTEGR